MSPKSLKAYKQLQIIEILNTISNGYTVLPTFMFVGPLLQSVMSYATIKLHQDLGMMELVLTSLFSFDGAFFIMIFLTLASNVWKNSSLLLSKWRSDTQRRRKLNRKTLKALRPLKIRFMSNFVDQCTPLVVEDFAIRTTVSLLLLSH